MLHSIPPLRNNLIPPKDWTHIVNKNNNNRLQVLKIANLKNKFELKTCMIGVRHQVDIYFNPIFRNIRISKKVIILNGNNDPSKKDL